MKERAIQFLEHMHNLLSDPVRWTKKVIARTAKGWEIGPTDPLAQCWCLGGALEKVAKVHQFSNKEKLFVQNILRTETLKRKYNLVCNMNDSYTHEQVLQFLIDCKNSV